MDSVYEKLYRQKPGFAGILKKILLIIVLLGIPTGLIMFGFTLSNVLYRFLAAIIAVFVLYYGYKLLYMKLNVEFECICLNGEIDVDKIYSKAMRKRLITMNAKEFEQFGLYDAGAAAKLKQMHFDTVIKATSNTEAVPHYAVLKHKTFARTLVVFEPDERMLEDIKKCARQLFSDSGFVRKKQSGDNV